ncbi:MAG: endonuclease domain-containing protein [Thermomicrobiales bacterium]
MPSVRDLRQRETVAEKALWRILRDRRLHSLKFRRQHPIGPFVADFCCPESRLIVELDGGIHEAIAEQDEERTRLLGASGYRVVRFPNDEVFSNPRAVIGQIIEASKCET